MLKASELLRCKNLVCITWDYETLEKIGANNFYPCGRGCWGLGNFVKELKLSDFPEAFKDGTLIVVGDNASNLITRNVFKKQEVVQKIL